MDKLYQRFHLPLNLDDEFCVYKHFSEEKVYGRNHTLMGPQIMPMSDTVMWRAIGTGAECGQLDTTYLTVRKSCHSESANCYHRGMLARYCQISELFKRNAFVLDFM